MTTPTTNPSETESRLQAALASTATATLPDTAQRPDFASLLDEKDAAGPGTRTRQIYRFAPIMAAAAVVIIALGVVVFSRSNTGTNRSPNAATTQPTGVTSEMVATDPPGVGFCDNFAIGCSPIGFEPLWPFATHAAAVRWTAENSNRPDAWQFNAEQTADRYVHQVLGLTGLRAGGDPHLSGKGVDEIVMSIGYRSGTSFHESGTLLLGRYTAGDSGPFEVLGSGRTEASFAFTSPRSAAKVGTPLEVAGRRAPIGSRVRIRVLGGPTVSAAPAGRNGLWTATITSVPTGVVTVVASAGGTPTRPRLVAIRGLHS